MSGSNEMSNHSAAKLTIEVRWSALHSRWRAADEDPPAMRCPYTRAEFVVLLSMTGPQHGTIDAWIETNGERRVIRESVHVHCTQEHHDDLLNIDAAPAANAAGRPLLLLTVRETDELLFVQSPLLAEAGWRGGTYDPPTGRFMARSSKGSQVTAGEPVTNQ